MKRINPPNFSVAEVYPLCISKVRNPALKNRLSLCIPSIETAEAEFVSIKPTNQLFKIARENVVNLNVPKSELIKVYTDRMVKADSPGRKYYNKIFLSANNGVCPFCEDRLVSTLDHYLAKSHYPKLTVTPLNLIPACHECNKAKTSDFPKISSEEFIHPYFDDISRYSWLKAKIVTKEPLTLEYTVVNNPNYSPLLNQRIKFHFKNMNLANLYSLRAISEIIIFKSNIKNFTEKYSSLEIKDLISINYKSQFEMNKNHWRTAFYEALINDKWFISTGYKTKNAYT